MDPMTLGLLAIGGLFIFKEVMDETSSLVDTISRFLSENKLVIIGIVALIGFYFYIKEKKKQDAATLAFERQMALKQLS